MIAASRLSLHRVTGNWLGLKASISRTSISQGGFVANAASAIAVAFSTIALVPLSYRRHRQARRRSRCRRGESPASACERRCGKRVLHRLEGQAGECGITHHTLRTERMGRYVLRSSRSSVSVLDEAGVFVRAHTRRALRRRLHLRREVRSGGRTLGEAVRCLRKFACLLQYGKDSPSWPNAPTSIDNTGPPGPARGRSTEASRGFRLSARAKQFPPRQGYSPRAQRPACGNHA